MKLKKGVNGSLSQEHNEKIQVIVYKSMDLLKSSIPNNNNNNNNILFISSIIISIIIIIIIIIIINLNIAKIVLE